MKVRLVASVLAVGGLVVTASCGSGTGGGAGGATASVGAGAPLRGDGGPSDDAGKDPTSGAGPHTSGAGW